MKTMIRLIFSCMLFAGIGCSQCDASAKMTSISYAGSDSVLAFGAEELRMFIDKAGSGCEKVQYVFKIDKHLDEYSWSIDVSDTKMGKVVELSGHDSTAVLHAIYTVLEKMGYRFEITGPVVPKQLNYAALKGYSETIKPAIKKRGIRFHMNFPQDLSSFPIDEAREYIRNLARMRMNQMTFHSYPGRLHNGMYHGKMWWAGRTYEEEMKLPENDPMFSKHIRNKEYYRIPRIEGYDDRPEERAKLMKEWTKEVFEQCKQCGMYLQLSFEPRLQPEEAVMDMFRDIHQTYPMLDAVELMTEENGGGAPEDPEEMRKALKEGFDAEELMEHPKLKEYIATKNEDKLVDMVREIAYNTKMAKKIRDAHPDLDLDYVIGVYVSKEGYNNLAAMLLERFVPKEFMTAQMPQYGSRWVAQRFAKEMNWLPASEWDRKIVYSWYEFDGIFFLQQMACDGVKHIVELAMDGSSDGQGNAILFNIWTTAKNRTSVRYGSLATIYGPIPVKTFYKEYAKQMGVNDPEEYAQAMKDIDLANESARRTWNIGFGCGALWMGWWPGQMQAWFDQEGKVSDVQKVYEDVLAKVKSLSASTQDGKWYLDYMVKQLECSVLHYQAVSRIGPIFPYLAKDGRALEGKGLNKEQQTEILKACKDATYFTNKYMQTYAGAIAERGDEGALLNYYYCMPQFLLMVQSKYGGDENAQPIPVNITDMWPPPAKWD